MPINTPIGVAFGAPLDFGKDENPSHERVVACHKQYCAALTELFDKYKAQAGCGDRKLEILHA
jgi:hypothetical protein